MVERFFEFEWSADGTLVGGGGTGEGRVAIWDAGTGRRIATFPAAFDFGGRRLLVEGGSGRRLLAAAFDEGTVTAYDLEGEVAWRADGLDGVQTLARVGASGVAVLCEGGMHRLLDRTRGTQTARLPDARSSYWAESGELLLIGGANCLSLHDWPGGALRWDVPRRSFAVLDAAVRPDRIAWSEANEALSIAGAGGELRWLAHPPPEAHFTRLRLVGDEVLAIESALDRRASAICWFDAAGRMTQRHVVEGHTAMWPSPDGSTVVLLDGELLATRTARPCGRLE